MGGWQAKVYTYGPWLAEMFAHGRAGVLAVLAALAVACGEDDPGAPGFTPEDPESDTTVMKLVFIPGSDKPVVRFYEWIPPAQGFTFEPGHWELMDHPPPGVGAGAAAAATSGAGSSFNDHASTNSSAEGLSSFASGSTLGVFTGGQSETGDPSSTLAYIYDLEADAFIVSSLTTPRSDHRMTTLQDGRVLVTGGFGPPSASVVHAGAELYDPLSGVFSATGDMNQARGFHQATLLPDGRVFVSGATFVDGEGWLNATELYDPVSGTFETVSDEATHRWDRHAAVLLGDGRVLLIGGHESDKSEFFDPASESFSPGPDLNTIHGFGLTATVLSDGRVLVVGGVEQFGGIPSAVAEVYDPASNEWTLVDALTTARRNHTAVLGADGTVLIAGGQNEQDGLLMTSEVFDPTAGTFGPGPELPVEFVGGAAVMLSR